MNIEQAKTIAITDILDKLGFNPIKQTAGEYWYLSPLRNEKTASFHVHARENIWYDFGEGKGGDIVAFVCAYLKSQNEEHTVSDALRWLRNMAGITPSIKPVETQEKAKKEPKLTITAVRPIERLALIRYLEGRGIPLSIATRYLQEVRVKNKETDKGFFALGLKNEEGGYELRTAFFKGCIGTKTITMIRGTIPKPPGFHVMEGTMDFLSVATRYPAGRPDMDSYVLNSLSCLQQLTPYIKGYGYRKGYTWLDNDAAGEKARKSLDEFFKTEESLKHCPMNNIYAPHKDVNAWHMHKLGLTPEG